MFEVLGIPYGNLGESGKLEVEKGLRGMGLREGVEGYFEDEVWGLRGIRSRD